MRLLCEIVILGVIGGVSGDRRAIRQQFLRRKLSGTDAVPATDPQDTRQIEANESTENGIQAAQEEPQDKSIHVEEVASQDVRNEVQSEAWGDTTPIDTTEDVDNTVIDDQVGLVSREIGMDADLPKLDDRMDRDSAETEVEADLSLYITDEESTPFPTAHLEAQSIGNAEVSTISAEQPKEVATIALGDSDFTNYDDISDNISANGQAGGREHADLRAAQNTISRSPVLLSVTAVSVSSTPTPPTFEPSQDEYEEDNAVKTTRAPKSTKRRKVTSTATRHSHSTSPSETESEYSTIPFSDFGEIAFDETPGRGTTAPGHTDSETAAEVPVDNNDDDESDIVASAIGENNVQDIEYSEIRREEAEISDKSAEDGSIPSRLSQRWKLGIFATIIGAFGLAYWASWH